MKICKLIRHGFTSNKQIDKTISKDREEFRHRPTETIQNLLGVSDGEVDNIDRVKKSVKLKMLRVRYIHF